MLRDRSSEIPEAPALNARRPRGGLFGELIGTVRDLDGREPLVWDEAELRRESPTYALCGSNRH
jgi:hypothetical protein